MSDIVLTYRTGKHPCPFCGGTYWIATAEEDSGEDCTMHSMPPCQKFNDLDALEFLTKARQARGIYLDEEVS